MTSVGPIAASLAIMMVASVLPAAPAADENIVRLPDVAVTANRVTPDMKARIRRILQEPQTARAAISRDGRYLAYDLNDHRDYATVRIVDLEHLDRPAWTSPRLERAEIWPDREPVGDINDVFSPRPREPGVLIWAPGNRLIYSAGLAIRAVDASGEHDREIVGRGAFGGIPAPVVGTTGPVIGVVRGRRQALGITGSLVEGRPGILKAWGFSSTAPWTFKVLNFLQAPPPVTVVEVDLNTGKTSGRQESGALSELRDRQGWLRLSTGTGIGSERDRGIDSGQLYFVYRGVGDEGKASLRSLFNGNKGPNFEDFLGGTALAFSLDDALDYGHRSIPIAFDRDPDVLYFASNVGRDTYGVYGLNLKTRKATGLSIKSETRDLVDVRHAFDPAPLVFDADHKLAGVRIRGTHDTAWLDQEVLAMERRLDAAMPGAAVEIDAWDDAHRRAVIRLSSESEPGGLGVFDFASNRMITFVPEAPWLANEDIALSIPVSFDAPGGFKLTGFFTAAYKPIVEPPPLVVYLHDIPDGEARPGIDRLAQALSTLGVSVLHLNYRGSAGLGVAFRNSIKAQPDRVPVEDVRTAVAGISAKYPVDLKKIAVIGEGMGGYFAIRAAQLFPAEFRAVVTLDAPIDPVPWYFTEGSTNTSNFLSIRQELRKFAFLGTDPAHRVPALDQQEPLMRPGLLLDREQAQGRDFGPGAVALRWAASANGNRDIEVGVIPTEPSLRSNLDQQVQLIVQIGEFFYLNLYKPNVEIGPIRVK